MNKIFKSLRWNGEKDTTNIIQKNYKNVNIKILILN